MRNRIFSGIIFFLFFIIASGLFYTQIIKHDMYKSLSEKNRIRVLPFEAPRGKIFDKNEILLVTNRISFDVEVVYQEIKDKEKVIKALGEILDIDRSILSKRIEKTRKMPFVPVVIAQDVGKSKAIQVEEAKLDLAGVVVSVKPLREYIYKDKFSHVVGYLGKISESELKRYKTYGYHMRDFVGKDGVERSYNDYLRGVDGGLQVEVDSRGRQLRLIALKEASPGRDIYLSLDLALQGFCDSVMEDKKGAILAMDPSTGAILALVSKPGFDPNVFVKPDNFKEVTALLNDSNSSPLMNRAISGAYPPGSVFKIVTATAALDTRKFDKEKTFLCEGTIRVGNRVFHCWKEEGHGTQCIKDAMRHSCNVFFYQLGLLAGVDLISKYAFKFGLGRPTGIDLPGEASGFVPTVSWKKKTFKEPWFRGETANYAIGQGYLLVTPLQIARVLCAVANGGKLVTPFIVEKIEDASFESGETGFAKIHKPEAEDIGISEETLKVIKEALKEVVNSERGTGLYARSDKVVISGKTGTAQNPQGASHAWFAGFAPFDEPKICVVVLLEHGGKGGLESARFARKIIEEAIKLKLL